MANIMNDTEKESTEKLNNLINNMTESEREKFLWIGEGLIFAKQMKNNE